MKVEDALRRKNGAVTEEAATHKPKSLLSHLGILWAVTETPKSLF